MIKIYFVPANSIAQIGGVVPMVRDLLSKVASVTAATTSSQANQKFVSKEADVVVVMAPRHGSTSLVVGRGVFEAVEAAFDAGLEAYLIDPDTLELLSVDDNFKHDVGLAGRSFKEWGTVALTEVNSAAKVKTAMEHTLESALKPRAVAKQCSKAAISHGYLMLAVHLDLVKINRAGRYLTNAVPHVKMSA